jgi:alpha-tubulin suppressor-like RCC1 family protein
MTRAAASAFALAVGALTAACAPGPRPQISRAAFAWGENVHGNLGDGSTAARQGPVRVAGLSDVRAVRAGYLHSVGLLGDGSVWVWGRDWGSGVGAQFTEYFSRACADLTSDCHPSPVPLQDEAGAAAPPARAIAAGWAHGLLVRADDGAVWAWGSNQRGELGYATDGFWDGPLPIRSSVARPVVNGPDRVVYVAGGEGLSLALQSGPPALSTWVWGKNDTGQLAMEINEPDSIVVRTHRMRPAQVPGLPRPAIGLAVGRVHVLALLEDGTVWGWGSNDDRQIDNSSSGAGSAEAHFSPIPVTEFIQGSGARPLRGIVDVAAGCRHSLALTSDGRVLSWGNEEYGQRAQVEQGYFDVVRGIFWNVQEVKGLGTGGAVPTAIAAGCNFSLALLSDGTVWAWGENAAGQLGQPTTTTCRLRRTTPQVEVPCSRTPLQVPGLSGVEQISAGFRHSVAVVREGGP